MRNIKSSITNTITSYVESKKYKGSLANNLNTIVIIVLAYKNSYISKEYFYNTFPSIIKYLNIFFNNGTLEKETSLFSGSANCLYTINFLLREGIKIDINKDYLVTLLTNQLIHLNSSNNSGNIYPFDYVSGSSGILQALSFEDSINKYNYESILNSELHKTQKIINMIKQKQINDFGFAHGITGVFKTACSFSQEKDFEIIPKDYFKIYLEYTLESFYEIEGIPYWNQPNYLTNEKIRMGWCYGSQSILYSIAKISDYVQNYTLKDWSFEKLNMISNNSLITSDLSTDCVCHGVCSYINATSVYDMKNDFSNTYIDNLDFAVIKRDSSYSFDNNDLLSGEGGVLLTAISYKNNDKYLITQLGLN